MAVVAKQHQVSSFVPIHKIEVYCFTWNNAIENIVCSLVCCCAPFHLRKAKLCAWIEDDGLNWVKSVLFLQNNHRMLKHIPQYTRTYTFLECWVHIIRKLPTFADIHVIWNRNVWQFIFVNLEHCVLSDLSGLVSIFRPECFDHCFISSSHPQLRR